MKLFVLANKIVLSIEEFLTIFIFFDEQALWQLSERNKIFSKSIRVPIFGKYIICITCKGTLALKDLWHVYSKPKVSSDQNFRSSQYNKN